MRRKSLLQVFALVVCLLCSLSAVAAEAYACYTSSNTTLTFYYDNLRSSRTGTTYDLNTGDNAPVWYDDLDDWEVSRLVFDPSFANARPTSTYCWFSAMFYVNSITGLEYLNTSEVTNMYAMFDACGGAVELESIDLSHFNTEKVTNMKRMFSFTAFTSLDLSSFNTSKVTDMEEMFFNSRDLTTIDVGSGWTTAAVSKSENMFAGCTSLVGGRGTTYNANYTNKSRAHVDGGTSNPGYFTDANAVTAYAHYTEWNSTLTFYYDNLRHTRIGPTYDAIHSHEWVDEYSGPIVDISHVVFNPSFANARPTNTEYWFSDMTIEDITGMEYFNTSEVTNMYRMFRSCSLSEIDVSHFNTTKVTCMHGMFQYCRNLNHLDLSSFNTSKVTDMNNMFMGCQRLTSLDVSSFNTANVEDMTYMFAGCTNLQTLDLSNFDTHHVSSMYYMFLGCSNLTTIYASSGWSTAALTDLDNDMFDGCEMLVGGQGTTYNPNRIGASYARIDGGTSNPGYLTGIKEAYAYYNRATASLVFCYDDRRTTYNYPTYDIPTGEEFPGWSEDGTYISVQSVYFADSFADYYPTSTYYWFAMMENLNYTSLSQTFGNLNTSRVRTMAGMFYDCSGLTHLDLSLFNTANVTDMHDMFYGCNALESLDLSSFNTSNVTDMSRMFYCCSNLTGLNVGSFNTSNVTNMASMFAECEKLTRLYVRNFNTDKVTNMAMMFCFCSGLTSLDLSSFNTDKVVDMNDMFCGCSGLDRIDVSNFNTSKVTNMAGMFGNCTGLTALDLSGFKTSKVTDMRGMFSYNNNLRFIYVGSGWSTAAVTQSSYMFEDCFSIKGEKGTTYNASHIDKAYAHVDGGTSNPGYLWGKQPYACYTSSNTTLTFYYDNQRASRTGTTYDLPIGHALPAWNSYTADDVTKVVFNSSFADARPTSTCGWMCDMSSLTSITGMEYLNTSEVTDMSKMFYRCRKLNTLDLSGFNTSKVTDMSEMFYNCTALSTIYVSPSSWTTAAVTSSENMFKGCTSLSGCEGTQYSSSHTDASYAHIDGGTSNPGYLSAPKQPYVCYTPSNTTLTFYFDPYRETRAGTCYDLNEGANDPAWFTDGTCSSVTRVVFDDSFGRGRIEPTTTYGWFKSMRNLQTITGMDHVYFDQVTNASYMFRDCVRLDSLDVDFDSYQTNQLTDVTGMFYGCTGLKSLKFRYNSENVTSMEAIFYGCSGLTSLDVHNFNTANVTNMKSMFQGCSSLQYLDVHNFNTANVTDMSNMFRGCTAMMSIDLTGWNTSKVTNMSYMFNGCSELRAIYVGNGWTTAAVTSSTGMFTGCTKLVGSAGTTYSSSHTNKAYAHIDGGTSNPGYLSTALPKPYSVFTPDNGTLTLYYDALWETRPGTVCEILDGQNVCNSDVRYSVTHVVIAPSFADARPTSTAYWFHDIVSAQDITGLEYLNTEDVTDMGAMFSECWHLATLDLSHFKTENVESMAGMFEYSSNLQSLDLSSFNTDNVTDMTMMFEGCVGLTSLDLSSFNTALVTDMSLMFEHCGNLTTIYVGPGWTTSAVTSSDGMFDECTKLKGGQGTAYNASHTDASYAHIDGGTSNPGYLSVKAEPVAYACFTESDSTLTFYYDNQWPYREGTTFGMNTGSNTPVWVNDPFYWIISHVVFDPSFADARPTSTHAWFSDFVQSIEGIEYLNTSEVTNMSNMFVFLGMENIDVSHFNTSKVTDMTAMFAFLPVTTLDLSNFNTENVTNMHGMFFGCQNLTTIYVGSGWSTEAVTLSEDMFKYCTSLVGGMGTTFDEDHVDAAYAHLDGGTSNPGYFSELAPQPYACYTPENTTLTFYYDTWRNSRPGTTYDLNTGTNHPDWVANGLNSSVTRAVFDPSFADARPTSMRAWFYCMENLNSITGVEYLNTTEVTDMAAMFMECAELTSLDLSSFNTGNVTNIFNMFYGCRNLMSLDVSSFNTAKVTDMRGMFRNCSSLTSLDLSSFNTVRVGHMAQMFQGCSDLTTIYVGEGWSTAAVNFSSDMFYGCTNIRGGMGTTYDANHVDKAYAHIDGGTSNPGYFTSGWKKGDVNHDGNIDVSDVTLLISYVLNNVTLDATEMAVADMNNDGMIDVADVTALIALVLSH